MKSKRTSGATMPRAGARGFTVLEVLVAVALASFALVVIAGGVSGGLASTVVAGHMQEALLRAESRLAEQVQDLRPRQDGGDDGDGFAWRVSMREDAAAPLGGETRGRAVLYAVSVSVSWRMDGGERRVVLNTSRAATAPSLR